MKDLNESNISDFLTNLVDLSGFSSDDIEEMRGYLLQDTNDNLQQECIVESEKEVSEKESNDIRTMLSKLRLPRKLKLALFGNATTRGILVLDGNRLIAMAVLKNPKLKERELEVYSRNPNISGAVLRAIGDNRLWMKSYAMKVNLVFNAKTPLDVATRYLRLLKMADLKKVSRSKNIPNALVSQARKKIQQEEIKKRGGS